MFMSAHYAGDDLVPQIWERRGMGGKVFGPFSSILILQWTMMIRFPFGRMQKSGLINLQFFHTWIPNGYAD